MPQMQLPMFPEGFTPITNSIGFQNRDGKVAYFYGHLPVFQHDTGDVQSFRLFTSQWIVQGTVSQTEIVKALGLPLITVKRYVKVLREEGSKGLFAERKRRSAPVLTAEVLSKVQARYWMQARACRRSGEKLGYAPTRCIRRSVRADWQKKSADGANQGRVDQKRA
jgi:transposase